MACPGRAAMCTTRWAVRPRHGDVPADITSPGSALAHPAHGPEKIAIEGALRVNM